MSYRYYFTCSNCDTKIILTNEVISEIDNHGFMKCSCGSVICPNDPQFPVVKKSMKDRQITTYYIYGIAAILGFVALSINAPAILPVIALGAGVIVRSQSDGELVELNGKLATSGINASE